MPRPRGRTESTGATDGHAPPRPTYRWLLRGSHIDMWCLLRLSLLGRKNKRVQSPLHPSSDTCGQHREVSPHRGQLASLPPAAGMQECGSQQRTLRMNTLYTSLSCLQGCPRSHSHYNPFRGVREAFPTPASVTESAVQAAAPQKSRYILGYFAALSNCSEFTSPERHMALGKGKRCTRPALSCHQGTMLPSDHQGEYEAP